MAYRCVQLKGINGTQMTPYGANYSNYGGYHDFTVSETGTAGYKKYSDFVEYIGENYLKHAYTGTQGPDEEINFVTVYEDEYFTIQDSVTLPYQDPESSRTRFLSYVGIRILYQGEVLVGSYSSTSSTGSDVVTDKMSFCFVVDDDNHLGQIILVSQGPHNNQYFWTFKTMGLKKDWGKIYNILIGRILVGATVKVNYYLPDYEYTYAKITYKQDSEPASETDGESVEILKDETSVNIEGLEEEKTYYFKIFTDKSESEAFPFLVPELIDYGNMIFNDNSEITIVNNNSSVTAITTPKFLVDTYKEKSTQSGYSYMNANANTWLIGPANKTTGYYHIFGWTLPTDKDIYIICQNDTGQNAYYVWIWWDGLTSRDMLGTNCGYSKWFVVSNSVIYYESGTALNNYSSFNNNLIVDNNRYWSQTGLGGDSSLKPIVWTEVNNSRIWVNGKKLT